MSALERLLMTRVFTPLSWFIERRTGYQQLSGKPGLLCPVGTWRRLSVLVW